ncbi:MAG: amino acid adenylation domain-containing protein [Clostridia bacterium]|nr:amino acid adenylation domain-containing protein [Clostridia bacterium]
MIRNILDYLENSAEKHGNKIAFADEERSLTFQQLMDLGKRIGSALLERQVPSKPIPVYMQKSPMEIAAFMGVVYSGNAYAPIDPQMPQKRVERILHTLEAEMVIADEACKKQLAEMGFAGSICTMEELSRQEMDENKLEATRKRMIDCDPLYIIFTSGSTGNPKGVAVPHRAVIDFTEWFSNTAKLDETCVFGNQAPFYFDMSVKDIYSTLRNGATTWIIPKKLFNFPVELFHYIIDHGINTLAWATSAVCLAAKEAAFEKLLPTTVRAVCFGGEAMPVKLLDIWRKYLPDAFYMNMYGPTETAVDCTYYVIEKGKQFDSAYFPAGFPCENTGILILKNDQPVQPGEIGEICVRGTALAHGYYNDPEKTSQVFVQNPLQKAYPELIYRTGDVGYYNPQGEIVFASRQDDQIKHMGYRIELGEIEASLTEIDGIDRCCCLFDKGKDKILCVYTGAASKKEILQGIGKYIPKYMWPNVFVQLAEMPMNLNGKIDRARLKAEYVQEKD